MAFTLKRPSFSSSLLLLLLTLNFLFVAFSDAQASVDPKRSMVFGSGLYTVAAGQAAVFYVQAVDTNGNNMTLCNLNFAAFLYNTTNNTVPHDCFEGLYSFHYQMRIALTYTLAIVYNGINVANSPYRPTVTPGPVYPPTCQGAGSGLTGGQVGVNSYFIITDYDAYGNRNYTCNLGSPWQVRLTGAATIDATIVNCTQGVFVVQYYAAVSGAYDIRVSLNGANLQNSPFHISLASGPISARYNYPSGIGATNATAGIITSFKVVTRDQFGNYITSCSAPSTNFNVYLLYGSTQVNATFTSCSSGQYYFSYNVTRAVSWQLFIYYLGVKSDASPSNIAVIASSIIEGENSQASGVGLFNGTAGVPAPFNIIPYDIFGNQITFCPKSTNFSDWTISVVGKSSSNLKCTASIAGCTGGLFNGQYVCFVSTFYLLSIAYQGSTIKGSPYSPYVQPGPIDGHTSIAFGPGLFQAYAGVPATFVIDSFDQYNNNIDACLTPLNPTFQITVSAIDIGVNVQGNITSCVGGNYTGQYIITKLSQIYVLSINYQGNAVDESPYALTTYAGPPFLANCQATGSGLTQATAGVRAIFQVVCRDQYQNPIKQCYDASYWNASLSGPASYQAFITGCSNSNGPAQYNFNYFAYRSGQYNLRISFTMTSPTLNFSPIVSPGPFSANNSIAIGQGVYSQTIPAGVNTTFLILSQDAYGNNLTYCISPSDLTIVIRSSDNTVTVYPSVKGCLNGQIPVSYQSTKAGPYSITISYRGNAIKNSPYSVAVIAGPISAPSCTASGPGLTQATAGVAAQVSLFCRDQYQNPVNYCSSNSSWSLSLSGPQQLTGTVPSCSSGTYYGYYVATKSGKYMFSIQYQGMSIQSSPFSPIVAAGALSDSSSLASGPGFTGANVIAGNATSLYVQAYDAYSNIITACTAPAGYWTATVSFNNSYATSAKSSSCNNGSYPVVFYPTIAGLNKVVVTGSSSNVRNNPGSVNVIPGPFNSQNSYADTFQNMAAGQIDPFWIYSKDAYNNTINVCSIPSSQYSSFVATATMGNFTYTGRVTSCANGAYQGTNQMNLTGTFVFRVTFGNLNTPIPTLKQYIYVTAGTPSATYSIARGPGVDPMTKIIAGTIANFFIDIYNQYGVRIVTNNLCSPITWTVKFSPAISAYPQNNNATIGNCSLATVSVYYNATTAGYYSIYIYGNGVPIRLNPYHSQVYPTYLDPARTQVEGLLQTFITFGTFTLVGRDIYGNPGVNLTDGLFTVSLSPSCSKSTLCCNFESGKLVCSFWVTEGGRYCVNINYRNQVLPLNTSSLLVYGGLGCGSGGCIHGFCYPTSPTSYVYSCSCAPGYSGVDCSVPPRSSEEGFLRLPSVSNLSVSEQVGFSKLSKSAVESIHGAHDQSSSSLKTAVDSSFVVVAIAAGALFGAYISKRRISSQRSF